MSVTSDIKRKKAMAKRANSSRRGRMKQREAGGGGSKSLGNFTEVAQGGTQQAKRSPDGKVQVQDKGWGVMDKAKQLGTSLIGGNATIRMDPGVAAENKRLGFNEGIFNTDRYGMEQAAYGGIDDQGQDALARYQMDKQMAEAEKGFEGLGSSGQYRANTNVMESQMKGGNVDTISSEDMYSAMGNMDDVEMARANNLYDMYAPQQQAMAARNDATSDAYLRDLDRQKQLKGLTSDRKRAEFEGKWGRSRPSVTRQKLGDIGAQAEAVRGQGTEEMLGNIKAQADMMGANAVAGGQQARAQASRYNSELAYQAEQDKLEGGALDRQADLMGKGMEAFGKYAGQDTFQGDFNSGLQGVIDLFNSPQGQKMTMKQKRDLMKSQYDKMGG